MTSKDAFDDLNRAARELETLIARWRRGETDWPAVSRAMLRTQRAERDLKACHSVPRLTLRPVPLPAHLR